VIPSLLSLYLVLKNRIWSAAAGSTLVVTIACYLLAQPVPGIGIAIPSLVPPIIASTVALLLARTNVAAVAYVSGSLGTLIGADLLNLGRIQGLGAPVVSIGGAGTFDGVFLTGIIAVLLASFSGRVMKKRAVCRCPIQMSWRFLSSVLANDEFFRKSRSLLGES